MWVGIRDRSQAPVEETDHASRRLTEPVSPVRLKEPCAKRHLGSSTYHHRASRAARRATLDQTSGSQRNAAGPKALAL